jgi:hypothetical protein
MAMARLRAGRRPESRICLTWPQLMAVEQRTHSADREIPRREIAFRALAFAAARRVGAAV